MTDYVLTVCVYTLFVKTEEYYVGLDIEILTFLTPGIIICVTDLHT